MKSVNIQNLKVGGEVIATEAEVPSNLNDLTKDTSGYKNLIDLKVVAGNGILFTEIGDLCGISTPVDTEMSDTSENAVENKVIKSYVDTLFNSIINGNEVEY